MHKITFLFFLFIAYNNISYGFPACSANSINDDDHIYDQFISYDQNNVKQTNNNNKDHAGHIDHTNHINLEKLRDEKREIHRLEVEVNYHLEELRRKVERYDQQIKPNRQYRNNNIYPVVLLHGITSDQSELRSVELWLKSNIPNQIFNIDLGNGKLDSIFKSMNWQLNELCMQIYNRQALANGFHFIGMSQGGLLARGYVEKCNKYPVINLITWVSPHGGVFGLNNVDINFKKIYTPTFQSIYSFASYWKDPFRYNEYLNFSTYLADLNNEKYANKIKNLLEPDQQQSFFSFQTNRDNLLTLTNFVMIWSPNDDVISPPESGKFSFYEINTTVTNSQNTNQIYTIYEYNKTNLPVVDLFDSKQYRENWLGLRTLYETNRLHVFETDCTHSGHKTEACFPQLEKLTLPFLI